MTNMHKFSTIENLLESTWFDISWDKTTHPIVSDNNWREYFELAEWFKSGKGEVDQLFGDVWGTLAIVRFWKELGVVVPDIVDSSVFTPVNAELVLEVGYFDFDVALVMEAISLQIVGLFLFVVLVVWSYDVHFFAYPCQFFWELVHHDSQTSHWTPASYFGGYECYWAQGVAAYHAFYCVSEVRVQVVVFCH